MLEKIRNLFSAKRREEQLQARLDELRQKSPVPLFWLFGRTQSGKTSIIKYLTSAAEAEIGQGFKPCTRYSRFYHFPTEEAPLLDFLDTRGVDEPGYDPKEDLDKFNASAHVVIVTAKVMDHALENILSALKQIRQARPDRPVVLALTCLHEAYPQQQHPDPYPFEPLPGAASQLESVVIPAPLRISLKEQLRQFEGLVDHVVPIDFTRPEEGFSECHFGGEPFKKVILDVLPAAYRQTLVTLEASSKSLQDLYAEHTLPHILGYSTLAATAGAIPVPWLDLFILPGIQTRMIYHLARLYGQPLSGARFLELAGTLGLGMLARQAAREVVKFIPFVGSVAGAALAGASTFALGKAFCFYYTAVHKGHVPQAEELRNYYKEQLVLAEKAWKKT